MNKTYWVIIRILCGMGCVYQTYKLSSIYFSYETTTFVRYESDGEKTLPAITICYMKYHQLGDQIWNNLGNNQTKLINVLDNMTIAEQFEQMEGTPKILKSCYTLGVKRMECTQLANLTKYIDAWFYCFTMFHQLNGEPDDSYQLSDQKFQLYIQLRRFTKTFSDSDSLLFVHMHSRKSLIYQAKSKSSLVFGINQTDYCLLKYSIVVSKVMFKPFNQCFVGQTREECVDKCMIDYYINKYGGYPSMYLAYQDNSSLRFKLGMLEKMRNNSEFDPNIKCKRFCDLKTECYKQYFITDSTFGRIYSNKTESKKNEFVLLLEYPAHPSTIYEVNLKMSFEEYLCLLSSIFSVWFGFSILVLTEFCPQMLRKINNYFQTIIQINFQKVINIYQNRCNRAKISQLSKKPFRVFH